VRGAERPGSKLTEFSDLTSSNSALHVSVYDRNKGGEGFLGMTDVKPVLKDGYALDSWYKLGTRGVEHVTGEIWIQVTYTAIRVSGSPHLDSKPAHHIAEQSTLETIRFRIPETYRTRYIRSSLPSTQKGYSTDIRHESLIEKGNPRKEGSGTHYR
jgi:hypothetical protein